MDYKIFIVLFSLYSATMAVNWGINTHTIELGNPYAKSALYPGIKARISQRGIQYAAEQASKVLSHAVANLDIPNLSGSHGKMEYKIKNMRLTFHPHTTKVTTVPFKWSLKTTSVSLKADWHYGFKAFISDRGSFHIKLSADISTTVAMGMDKTGRPTIHTTHCHSDVTKTDADIHGGASWLYNALFDGIINQAIKELINKHLCKAVEVVINVGAEQTLSSIPVELDFHDVVILDYSLVSPIAFTPNYIDVMFKGEFFWKSDRQECPFNPDPIPATGSQSKMISFWISEYSINSLGYAAYKHGALTYELSKTDVPPGSGDMLDITCQTLFPPCIGGLLPQLGKRFPNSSVLMHMTVAEAPVLDIAPSGMIGKWAGLIKFKALMPNATKRFMFSCNALVIFNITTGISDLNITATITDFKIQMTLEKSAIGPVDMDQLYTMVKLALSGFIVPTLNELGREGIKLPEINHVTYINPTLKMLDNSLCVSADLKYTG